MPATETKDLLEYIDQLVDATNRDTLDWTKPNPSTYIWTVAPSQPARVILQQIIRNVTAKDGMGRPIIRAITSYVFQALDSAGTQRLNVSGDQAPEINVKLEQLYAAISAYLSRKGLEFLKSILPPK